MIKAPVTQPPSAAKTTFPPMAAPALTMVRVTLIVAATVSVQTMQTNAKILCVDHLLFLLPTNLVATMIFVAHPVLPEKVLVAIPPTDRI